MPSKYMTPELQRAILKRRAKNPYLANVPLGDLVTEHVTRERQRMAQIGSIKVSHAKKLVDYSLQRARLNFQKERLAKKAEILKGKQKGLDLRVGLGIGTAALAWREGQRRKKLTQLYRDREELHRRKLEIALGAPSENTVDLGLTGGFSFLDKYKTDRPYGKKLFGL